MKKALLALIIAIISSESLAYSCYFTLERDGDDSHFGDWFTLRVKTDAKGKNVVIFTDLEADPELGNISIIRRSQFEKGTGRTIRKQAKIGNKMSFRFISDKDLTGIPAGTHEASVGVSVFCGALADNQP